MARCQAGAAIMAWEPLRLLALQFLPSHRQPSALITYPVLSH